eukprot:127749_1
MVYNREEHPYESSKEWFKFDNQYHSLKEHGSIQDRHNALKFTLSQWKHIIETDIKNKCEFDSFLFLLDNMNDNLLISFNTIPERIIILYQNKIVYKTSYFTDTITEINVIEKLLQKCT